MGSTAEMGGTGRDRMGLGNGFGIAREPAGWHTPAPMNATTLQCHSCGAAVSGSDPACAHCGARLATVSCPSCFNMMYRDARFCPACGSPAAQWESGPADQACPTCQQPMLLGTLGQIRLHECTRCFGLWVDAVTFEQICRQAEQQSAALGQATPAPEPNTVIEPVRYRPCPACRQLMNRMNFARCSGVIVDVCRPHGTWFDAEELHRIVRFIQAGGLDRARDREKAALAEERRRLQAARTSPDAFRPIHSPSTFVGRHPDLVGGLLETVVSATGELLTGWLDPS